MKFINIDKNQIPYEFEIVLDNSTFQLELNYNSVGDFFTVSVKKDHVKIVDSYKVVYNVELFENLKYLGVPKVVIKPFDTTGIANKVDYDNLNEDVFLYVLDS
ncbi:hypothetical protein LV469_02910 [Peptoniphilus sp. GNH]|nr:hypothetical protein LV469_02910 [Peptoniphilus sp. GNH]